MLMRASRMITFNEYIQPIEVADELPAKGTKLRIVSFPRSERVGNFLDGLYEEFVTVAQENSDCFEVEEFNDHFICTNAERDSDLCFVSSTQPRPNICSEIIMFPF